MTMKDKKTKKEKEIYETKVLKRRQGIENARNERELREYQDQMQISKEDRIWVKPEYCPRMISGIHWY
jgi:hypothetical protein